MTKSHLKRHAAPKTWKLDRKKHAFITRPMPGGFRAEETLPVSHALKECLKLAKTTKEVKYILNNTKALIFGKEIKDHKRPVGLLEVIDLPAIKKSYRLVVNSVRKLSFVEVDAKEKNLMVGRITGKTHLPGGKLQLNVMGGYNIIAKEDAGYRTGDCLVIDMEKRKAIEHLGFEKGMTVYLIGGKHSGKTGTVEDISKEKFIFKTGGKDVFETLIKYAVVVGKDKPLISLS